MSILSLGTIAHTFSIDKIYIYTYKITTTSFYIICGYASIFIDDNVNTCYDEFTEIIDNKEHLYE